jgi:hypothetical protein
MFFHECKETPPIEELTSINAMTLLTVDELLR